MKKPSWLRSGQLALGQVALAHLGVPSPWSVATSPGLALHVADVFQAQLAANCVDVANLGSSRFFCPGIHACFGFLPIVSKPKKMVCVLLLSRESHPQKMAPSEKTTPITLLRPTPPKSYHAFSRAASVPHGLHGQRKGTSCIVHSRHSPARLPFRSECEAKG